MAVEAVVALMEDELGKLLSNEEAQLLGVRGEIEHIRGELKQMRRFLKDADIKQKEDERVRNWMEDIRDICFDVDDVIDILGQGQAAHGSLGFVKRLITRYKVGKAIKRIKLNIKDVSKSRESYGIRKIDEERPEATSSTQNLQEVNWLSVPPDKIVVIPTVDDQLTNEERTRDSDGGRHEVSSSSRNLQAHRRVSTLPGEPEEEINTVSQQLIKEEPSPSDRKRDIDEGRPEASPSALHLQEDKRCSVEKLEIVISTVDDQLTNEERTRDIDIRRHEKRQTSSEAVVPYIAGKLGDLLIQEAELLSRVREQVKWIKNELEWMQRFLKDADSKQNIDERVKQWVSDIRDVSYEIEDVIDTFIYLQKKRHGHLGRVKRGISQPKTRHEVAKQIEQIKQKISDISRRRANYGIRDINEGRQEASSSIRDLEGRRRDYVMFEEPQLVGQHEEFKTVRDQLMTEEQRRRVISIFGIGGSGKTALAKKILNDVKDHFDCHALVYVSQQCNIKDVLVRIIKGVAGHSPPKGIQNLSELDLWLMLSEDYLGRKRYLVVFDGIWTREAWDSLILKLPDDGNKSRVLVTTRIRDVALHADPSGHHHEMRLLNDDESWELFMKKIFPGKDPLTACPSELKEKGWKILKKCGGLPLAILVLGGLLATKEKTIRVWSDILDRVPHHLIERSKQFLEILALSYWDLPHYLKPCFLHVNLFPEDYEISSGKLIRLWIAEGFIQREGNNVMEDVAEDYLEELVSRSMIQVASTRSNGSINKYRTHNLLRELSISEARKNNFFTVHNDNDSTSSSTSVRRLAVYRNMDGDETTKYSIETLRSILYFLASKVDVFKLPNTSSKLLRVLNVESKEVSIVSLPKEVEEFVLLKFLEFSDTCSCHGIPPSIGNLSSLQTLNVLSVWRDLPNTIWDLKKLRHLRANAHIEGHPHLSNLTNLQTLSLTAGSWIEEGLGKLTNLRKLEIHIDLISDHATLPYCIEKLRNLRSLKLLGNRIWADGSPPIPLYGSPPFPRFLPFTHHRDLYKMYLRGCIQKLPELPPNLVELRLESSELEQDAISTLEKLQHLKILELFPRSYLGRRLICSRGGFPRLEFLTLHSWSLEEWIVEEGAMISLKSVILFDVFALKTDTLPERVRAVLNVIDRRKKN